ncbi:MAG: hypothetical protein RL318_550 [Fibrobacterota bacterium]
MKVAPRLRRGWRLERKGAMPELVVPAVLEGAPLEVAQALAQWVHSVTKPSPGSRVRQKQAAKVVFAWMGDAGERLPSEVSKGRHWDLRPLFDELNLRYFQGELQAVLRWTPREGTTSTHRKVAGIDLLTISRRFDGPAVPREAVLGVLSHEMLHIAIPPREGSGVRRIVHHKAFREAERAFPFHAAWREWEAEQSRSPWWKRLLGRKK